MSVIIIIVVVFMFYFFAYLQWKYASSNLGRAVDFSLMLRLFLTFHLACGFIAVSAAVWLAASILQSISQVGVPHDSQRQHHNTKDEEPTGLAKSLCAGTFHITYLHPLPTQTPPQTPIR